jgi:nicotinamidase-related amidase
VSEPVSSPLLVAIDMQHVFRDAESPWATPGFDEIVEPIDTLVGAFGDRVVFTRYRVPEHPEGSWVPYFELWSEVARPERRGWLKLVEPWASRRPRTLEKESFSKWGPELRDLAGESKTLVLCGVATDCCVISSALPAADDGMFVRIVADACRGATADAHARALAIMGGYAPQIVVSTVGDELTRLDGLDARLGSPSGQSLM